MALALGAALFSLTRTSREQVTYRDRACSSWWSCAGWAWCSSVLRRFSSPGLMGPVDAFFNSMAGFTTTGAATVTPEELSPALLLWRSLSQWIGGIGIIVLFVAIAPLAGFGATQLYTAEAATPVQERVTPRIRDTVKVLAFVYGGLTLGGVVVLHLAGMGTFDAVNYALSTVSTGGFSTDSELRGSLRLLGHRAGDHGGDGAGRHELRHLLHGGQARTGARRRQRRARHLPRGDPREHHLDNRRSLRLRLPATRWPWPSAKPSSRARA